MDTLLLLQELQGNVSLVVGNVSSVVSQVSKLSGGFDGIVNTADDVKSQFWNLLGVLIASFATVILAQIKLYFANIAEHADTREHVTLAVTPREPSAAPSPVRPAPLNPALVQNTRPPTPVQHEEPPKCPE